MSLTWIVIFAAGGLLFGALAALAARDATGRLNTLARRARPWLMLSASVTALYWLQSSTPIRHLDFWLPTATLGLTGLVWAATLKPRPATGAKRPDQTAAGPGTPDLRATFLTGLVMAGIVALIASTRYVDALCCLTPSRPPEIGAAGAALLMCVAVSVIVARLATGRAWLDAALVALLLALFVALKTEPLTAGVSALLRALTGQSVSQASALDVRWLGFSYIAFRLIHVLRDHAGGRLPALSLREFVTYVVFFPALAAGPIDRAERFVKDLRGWDAGSNAAAARVEDVAEGLRRILIGVFKKFALADTLALIALNPVNAGQIQTAPWAWVLLYAYAFRLYFDFSGYTDIAIGMGRLFGARLPENFDRPYLRPNLTMFWNSWHMTLANWFRAYWFNPLTRWLRTAGGVSLSPSAIIFIGQTSTMLLIGLWHGVTWNYALWGAWHAAGLFIHNRWTAWARSRQAGRPVSVWRERAMNALNIALTFHFVALGWVWFVLPDVGQAVALFARLFGG